MALIDTPTKIDKLLQSKRRLTWVLVPGFAAMCIGFLIGFVLTLIFLPIGLLVELIVGLLFLPLSAIRTARQGVVKELLELSCCPRCAQITIVQEDTGSFTCRACRRRYFSSGQRQSGLASLDTPSVT